MTLKQDEWQRNGEEEELRGDPTSRRSVIIRCIFRIDFFVYLVVEDNSVSCLVKACQVVSLLIVYIYVI